MANTFVTSSLVTKEIARGFTNNLKFLANINRAYDDQYKQFGTKVGATVNARMPQRLVVSDGQALQLQNLTDATVPITLTNQKQVAFGWSSAQATTDLEDVRKRYINPGAEAMANAADVLAFQAVYKDIWNSVGTPGTTPTTALTYLQAGVKLTDQSAPETGRVAMLDPMAMVNIANTASTLFHPGGQRSESWKSGQFAGNQLGLDGWYQDVNRPVHTTGTFTASTPLVKGASQTGSVLITDGWASSAATLNKGDVFTIAGVYSVNPLSYASTGRLQQFVVTATTTSVGVDMATLPISPAIITSGQLQTVSNSPADDAVITVLGATSPAGGTLATTVSPQSFVYHPDFATFVMADLMKPSAGCEATVVRSKAFGFSIRMVEQYQIGTDQNPTRLDMLIGAATLQARLAVRVWG
jgi:hypothetical protein